MDNSINERFAFFRVHFFEAKRDFKKFKRDVSDVLLAMQSTVKHCKSAGVFEDDIAELERDSRIYASRLMRISEAIDKITPLVSDFDRDLPSMTAEAADNAVKSVTEAFMRWRASRRDFSECFGDAISKWRQNCNKS